jgi:cyclopropane fatty-acyl-phospholipid synthase-like methyltransferase
MKKLLPGLAILSGCSSPAAHDAHGPHASHGDHAFHHRFENPSEWAKTFDAADRDAWQRPAELTLLLELSPGMVVADIGAGTGYFLPYLSPAVGDSGKVLALDVEAEMVDYMKARATKEGLKNIEARAVDPSDPALAPGTVDRVVLIDTWHHIEQRVEYTRRLAAGLKPGGSVYIVDFTLEASHGPPAQHRLSPAQVMEELTAGGLVAEVMTETLPDQYVVRGKKVSP